MPTQESTFTSCTYTYVRRGWVADTTRASKLQFFFFVPVPFFFNASSSIQGGFSAHFAQCSYAPAKRALFEVLSTKSSTKRRKNEGRSKH